jgi:hypothetical protein
MKWKDCAAPRQSHHVIGYLRVSIQDQDLEKNKADFFLVPKLLLGNGNFGPSSAWAQIMS